MPEWADRYRKLAKEAGNSSGSWRTARVEIARGPMLAVTEPGVRKLSAMVATQLLKSSLLENVTGYHMHLDPCPMLIVQPKDAAAEQFSKERVGPLINATPVLKALLGKTRTRDGGDTLDYKAFPGGFLGLVGAGSPDNLARRPIRIVMYDEVDKYLPIKEGNPIDIGDERLASFESNSLSIRVCSPTIKGESKIEASFAESDQRRASVACPHCGHRQFLEFFTHVHWTGGKDGKPHRPETAQIHCEACGAAWSEGNRQRALATIRWHQTRSFECCGEPQNPLDVYAAASAIDDAGAIAVVWDWWQSRRWAVYRAKCGQCGAWSVPNEHAGFQASKLYSPWANDTPARIAAKYLAAKGDEDKLLSWWNTQMALAYRKNAGKELRVDRLAARCEVWAADVPDGVAVLAVGIDVQDYRVELEVVGWGRNEESWSVAYETIDGEFDDPKVQALLDKHLMRTWHRADGRPFAIAAACIDTGGHHTNAVYDFAKARFGRRIWGIKGESARTGQRNPVWPTKRPTLRSKKSYRPYIIGVNAAKDTIRNYLAKEVPGAGYMHFTTDRDINYFQQLTAERTEIKQVGGHKYRVWVPIAGRANEALDCRVYAYAALHGLMHIGLRLNREADQVGAIQTVTPIDGDAPDDDASETEVAVTLPRAAPGPTVNVDVASAKRTRASRLAS